MMKLNLSMVNYLQKKINLTDNQIKQINFYTIAKTLQTSHEKNNLNIFQQKELVIKNLQTKIANMEESIVELRETINNMEDDTWKEFVTKISNPGNYIKEKCHKKQMTLSEREKENMSESPKFIHDPTKAFQKELQAFIKEENKKEDKGKYIYKQTDGGGYQIIYKKNKQDPGFVVFEVKAHNTDSNIQVLKTPDNLTKEQKKKAQEFQKKFLLHMLKKHKNSKIIIAGKTDEEIQQNLEKFKEFIGEKEFEDVKKRGQIKVARLNVPFNKASLQDIQNAKQISLDEFLKGGYQKKEKNTNKINLKLA